MGPRSVTVSVLFTDLVDSTRLFAALGADGADEVRRAHDVALAGALDAPGRLMVKHLGDGAMAVFESAVGAVAAGREVQRAVHAARRRHPAIPEVRIGLATGEAVPEDGDWFGPPVVEAARLCAEADGGQVLATQLVALLVAGRGDVDLRPLGPRTLKGFDAPIEVVEVPWAATAGAGVPLPDAAVAAGRTALAGRVEARRILSDAWAATSTDGPTIAVVSGDPGVGKTRLAADLAAVAHASGATVLWGHADEDVTMGLQPFIEAVRQLVVGLSPADLVALEPSGDLARLVPEVAEIVPGLPPPTEAEAEGERIGLFDAVTHLVLGTAELTPVLLVLDDLQWASPAAVQLLSHLVAGPGCAPLMVLCTYRDVQGDVGEGGRLAELFRAADVRWVSLDGLDEDGVAEMVGAVVDGELGEAGHDLARALREQTGGNPFFVGQVLGHLVESDALDRGADGWRLRRPLAELGLPQGVRQVVARRLARLPAPARRTLLVAAVVGPRFALGTVEQALGEGGSVDVVDLLDAAVDARLVREAAGAPGRYVFVHALVRQTLLDELSTTKRARLHHRIGEAMAASADPDPVAVAHHLCAGAAVGGAAAAMEWCQVATWVLAQSLDHAQMIEVAQRGIEAAAHDDPRRAGHHHALARLRLSIAAARHVLGDVDESKAEYLRAADEARAGGEVDDLVLAALGRIGWGTSSTLDPVGRALLDEARRLVPPGDDVNTAKVEAWLAFYMRVYETVGAEAEALSRSALERARRSGDPEARWEAGVVRSMMLTATADLAGQWAVLDEMRDVAAQLGTDHPRFESLQQRQRTTLCLQEGDRAAFEEALATFEELTAVGDAVAWALSSMWRGMAALMDGDLRAAEEHLDVLGTRMGGDVNLVASWGAQLVQLRSDQGRVEEVLPLLRASVEDNPAMVAVRVLLAWMLVEAGEGDAAGRLLDAFVADDLAAVPRDALWSGCLPMLAATAWRLGDVGAAETVLPHLLPFSGQVVVVAWGVVCLGAADGYVARLSTVLGRPDEADRRYAAAIAREDALGAAALAARTRLAWARDLLAREQPAAGRRAEELLGEVRTAAAALGLVAIGAEADDLRARR